MSRSKGGRPPLRGSVTGNTPSINGRKASQSIMLASRGNRLFKALSRSMISCSSKRPLVGRCFMISKRSNAAGIVKILRGQVINKFLEVPISVYSIDSGIFENELADTKSKGSENKSRSIWPLPGGIYSYVETLNLLLDRVAEQKSSREDMIKWFLDTFENVSSAKTATGYLNVPRNMGLIEFDAGECILTEPGQIYRQSKDVEFLFRTISDNILAFGEVYQFLLSSSQPKSDQEVLEYIIENFDVDWTTLAQVNFRLLWLINLGKVEKIDAGYKAK